MWDRSACLHVGQGHVFKMGVSLNGTNGRVFEWNRQVTLKVGQMGVFERNGWECRHVRQVAMSLTGTGGYVLGLRDILLVLYSYISCISAFSIT